MRLLARLLLLAAAFAAAATGVSAAEDQYSDSAGVQLRYVEEGRGEPVVLVHGYTVDIESQFVASGVLPALAKSYRVIAFDARSHGKSDKPHDAKRCGPEMGLDVVRLLAHLSIRKAHIVGTSMGAHIVAQLVTTHSERFITATLGGASGRRNWSAEDERRVAIEAGEMDQGLVTSQIVRLWPKDRAPPSAEEVRRISAERLAGKDPLALAAVRRSNRDQVVTETQMAAVTVPVLGIVGTADPYLKEFEALKAAMPQLRLVTIEGASHGSAPARPEFVAALKAFLAEHPARLAGG